MRHLNATRSVPAGLIAAGLLLSSVPAAAAGDGPDIRSAGPLAFSPDGVLFVGDPKQAKVFAIESDDFQTTGGAAIEIDGVAGKLAAMLGTTAEDVAINDMAVNPATGTVCLSVSRGRGPDAVPVLMTVTAGGELAEMNLENAKFSGVTLPNPPEDKMQGEGRRRRNSRMEAITDLTFLDGRLYIAGLSNEDFASNLRSVAYPFEAVEDGTSIEIFHGAHGKYETRSPVRTFTTFQIDEEPHLLAAYTCTPLVKIPVSELMEPGDLEKVRGTTVAELGNRNRPLDMIVYDKDGEDFVLMANSSRGLMKVSTEGIADIEGITERISGTAGLPYETLDVQGVTQLDRLDKDRVVLLIEDETTSKLTTMDLP